MLTVNTLIKEIKQIPKDKLGEVHKFIKSLNQNSKRHNSSKKDLMSFAGSWKDISEEDFKNITKEIKRTRKNLFSRKIKI